MGCGELGFATVTARPGRRCDVGHPRLDRGVRCDTERLDVGPVPRPGYDGRMALPISRVRAVPWVMVVQLAVALRRHWKYLTPAERIHLAHLLKKSQGKPGRLTPVERADVRRLVRKLEPFGLVRSVAPVGKRALGGRR